MNHALRRISLLLLAMFLLLLLNVNYVQAFEPGTLAVQRGNARTFSEQFQFQRGSIITADNKTIALSRHVKGIYSYQRYYPAPTVYAPVTGYDSLYSATGIEQAEDKFLSASDPKLAVHNLIDLVTGKPKKGATIQLTINSAAQTAAYDALRASGLPSGAVAIDPSTGAILALASYPSFNPNKYATFDGVQLQKIDHRYLTDPRQPLLNRAINQTFPPGSTFKIVTASALAKTGLGPASTVQCPGQVNIGGRIFHNYDNEQLGTTNLQTAFAISCNSTFAMLATQRLDGPSLASMARRFGFNASPALGIPATLGRFTTPHDPVSLAADAFGQGTDIVNPLSQACMAAAIADGTWRPPQLVISPAPPQTTGPHKLDSAILDTLRPMMQAVVTIGTASHVGFPPGVYGKTGTAEYGTGRNPPTHAWFVGYRGDLAFAVLVCILTAIASGLVPALQACRPGLNEALKEGGRGGSSGPQAHRVRAALVISQVSLALVALVAAGLFMRSFEASRKISPGFDTKHVLVSHFYLSTDGYNLEQRKEFCRRLQAKLESDPGVTDVSYSDIVPLGFEGNWWEDLRIEGYTAQPGENMRIWRSVVPPGYFHFMRIPLLEGRDFTDQDDETSQHVMTVNQTFANRFFRGLDPIGRRVHGWGEWFNVVGVVKDSKYGNLAEGSTPYFYVPIRQTSRADMLMAFYLRTPGNPTGAVALLRREVHGIDPNVTVFDPVPLADYIGASLYPQKIAASMLSILGGLALLLAAVGLYGAMAYSVAQRVHEIGIRMALGAKRGDVLTLVVRQGMKLALAGAALGIVAALAVTRLLSSLLYGVGAADPTTYIAVALFLSVVALIACLVPARRAAKVDPMVALRYE